MNIPAIPLLATLLLAPLAALHAADMKPAGNPNILFIGNSYTSCNQLPDLFRQVVASTGTAAPCVAAATVGGYTFQRHLARPESLAQIDQGSWDVVILQGESTAAAHPDSADDKDFLQGAGALYDRIKQTSPRARVVLYETWARHADLWKSGNAAARFIGGNPAEMQANIRKGYGLAAAQRKDFIVAPVGDAWELNYKNPHALRLHRQDNSHPEFNGSYLAALVFYATIYHPGSLNVPYHGSLSVAEAGYLQKIASEAIKQQPD